MTMYTLRYTSPETVIRYEDFPPPTVPPTLAPEKNMEWVLGGPPPAAPTLADYEYAVQAHLDSEAIARGYAGILSACSYAGDPNPKFDADGICATDWRSAVWTYCYDFMASGQTPPPVDEFIAMLPTITWPAR